MYKKGKERKVGM
jgi:hypothetical protein